MTEPPEKPALINRIVTALNHVGYAELRNLEFSVDQGHVRLWGRLPSYYLKQLAHQSLLEIPDVKSVTDDIVFTH